MADRSITALHPRVIAANALAKGADVYERLDSWVNVALGFGTSRDKTAGGFFQQNITLNDQELAGMYAHDDIAAKIVNIYPREAMREGYCLGGLDADTIRDIGKFLEPWKLEELFTDSWIWSRLFGGGAIWVGADDGSPPDRPLTNAARKIAFVKFYDRRWLNPFSYYKSGPKIGKPETYMLSGLAGSEVQIGVIHETRLIRFPGARTEVLAQRQLNSWDYSVLQVAYDALKSSGNVWKSIELLVSDANQGVFKIKNLWSMMAGAKGAELKTRVTMMDLTRSVARAILIDKEAEEFDRQSTTFSGLADLDDRSARRVARAAEVPISLIAGEQPKGLNASGDSELTWFWARVAADQKQILEPNILLVLRMLLSTEGSPVKPADLDKIKIKWHPLWQPSAKEKAEIYKIRADGDAVYVNNEIVPHEAVLLSRFGQEEPGELLLPEGLIEAAQQVLESDVVESGLLKKKADPNADPNVDPNADPNAPAAPADPNAEVKDPQASLNGAQVTGMLAIVQAVANEEIPRDAGIAMLVASFAMSEETAEKVMGTVGKGFTPKKPDPVAPFGGGVPGAPVVKPVVPPVKKPDAG